MNNIKKKYIAYIIIATVIIYGIVRYFNTVEGYIGNITKALMPFVAGAVMAYIINILMDFYEDLLLRKFHNKKIIRIVSIVLSIFTFVLVIGLLLGLIIPQLVKIMFSIMYTNPGDIKKIIALTKIKGENGEVTVETVRSALSDNIEHGIFKVIDAISNKRKDMSLDLLNQLILSGENEYTILGAIISQLEVMLIVKELMEKGHGKDDNRKMTKLHPFRIKKCIGVTRNYHSETLKKMLILAYETDIRIKRGLLDSRTALELLI